MLYNSGFCSRRSWMAAKGLLLLLLLLPPWGDAFGGALTLLPAASSLLGGDRSTATSGEPGSDGDASLVCWFCPTPSTWVLAGEFWPWSHCDSRTLWLSPLLICNLQLLGVLDENSLLHYVIGCCECWRIFTDSQKLFGKEVKTCCCEPFFQRLVVKSQTLQNANLNPGAHQTRFPYSKSALNMKSMV